MICWDMPRLKLVDLWTDCKGLHVILSIMQGLQSLWPPNQLTVPPKLLIWNTWAEHCLLWPEVCREFVDHERWCDRRSITISFADPLRNLTKTLRLEIDDLRASGRLIGQAKLPLSRYCISVLELSANIWDEMYEEVYWTYMYGKYNSLTRG